LDRRVGECGLGWNVVVEIDRFQQRGATVFFGDGNTKTAVNWGIKYIHVYSEIGELYSLSSRNHLT
jgi:hypothetical protein